MPLKERRREAPRSHPLGPDRCWGTECDQGAVTVQTPGDATGSSLPQKLFSAFFCRSLAKKGAEGQLPWVFWEKTLSKGVKNPNSRDFQARRALFAKQEVC